MSATHHNMDDSIIPLIRKMAKDGINHAINGLSEMVGAELTSSDPAVSFVPVLKVPMLLGGPETEAVGIYLTAEGEMAGQFMLILPYENALEMIDLIMFEPPGTTKELESLGRSALAEVGNLTGAFFLNSLASVTGRKTTLSPPEVLFDMVGAILNIIVAKSAESVDRVIMIRTNIHRGNQDVQANFWYVPDAQAIEAFTELAAKK